MRAGVSPLNMNKQIIIETYTTIRAMERITIGCACMGAIVLAIVFDVWYQSATAPIEYVATVAHAEELEPREVQFRVEINWTRERLEQEVETKAKEYGVSAQLMKDIIKCESNWDTDVQSHHTLSYGREKSFGLVQIHLPSHPTVSYEEAIDPAFAINFLAEHIADGSARMWSCYKMVR